MSRPRQPASTARRVVICAITLVGAGAVALAGLSGWTHLGSHGHIYSSVDAPHRPVGIVLGAQIYPDGTPSPFLRGRLAVARELYDSGKVDRLIVSGDNDSAHYNEPDGMRRYLIEAGVPDGAIEVDPAGFDTYQSCTNAKGRGVTAVALISQGYHLPRAVTTCRALGVDAIGVADDSVRSAHPATWHYGVLREIGANVKALWDLLTA